MVNYFFDNLPLEIIEYIYSLRLFYYLQKKYYAKIAQKNVIINLTILNTFNRHYLSIIEKNIIENKDILIERDYYFDPINKKNYFILKKISNILSYTDDINWWKKMFINPLHNGLILREYLFNNTSKDKLDIINIKKYLFNLSFNTILYNDYIHCD